MNEKTNKALKNEIFKMKKKMKKIYILILFHIKNPKSHLM
jgi:hypothetical protein